jgi:hypothetical protein
MYKYNKWKPSKAASNDFVEQMNKIREFCKINEINISSNNDSYYFTHNNINYRVSNHTIAASDRGMFREENGEFVKIRDSYHESDTSNTVYITAGTTRIIEIYNAIKDGLTLNKRGYVKN